MGYAALGGLAAVLISADPVQEAWQAGGFDISNVLMVNHCNDVSYSLYLKEFCKVKF